MGTYRLIRTIGVFLWILPTMLRTGFTFSDDPMTSTKSASFSSLFMES